MVEEVDVVSTLERVRQIVAAVLRVADLDLCNVGTLICHVANIAKCRALLDLAKILLAAPVAVF
jgi:hypothetical protein